MRAIWDEIQHIQADHARVRSFGFLVGGVLLGIALFSAWRHDWALTTTAQILLSIGGPLVVLGAALPRLLTPLYYVWMGLAVVLGFVMSRVVLTLVYLLVVTPIGWMLRLSGKDLLDHRLDPDRPSYWKPKVYRDESAKRLEKLF